MSGTPKLASLVQAETRKLLSRSGVLLCVATLALLAVGLPTVMWLLSQMVTVSADNAEAGTNVPSVSMVTVLKFVLSARNFFLFRAMIIAVVAVSFAGEFTSRTLREDLIRPVTRARVLAAKWLALQVFVVIGALLPLVLAAPVGALFFGTDGDVAEVLAGFALTWLGDVGFATLVMAISLGLRSVPGTIGGVFMYWVLDRAIGLALWGAEAGRSLLTAVFNTWGLQDLERWVDVLVAVRPWLPSAAFNVYWDYDPDGAWLWQSYVALGGYTLAAYAFALWWFQRLDVD